VMEIKTKIVTREHDDVPQSIRGNEDAMAFYGLLKPLLINSGDGHPVEQLAVESANEIITILDRNRKVNFWDDHDAQKRTMNEIDDYLYDGLKDKYSLMLTTDQMDEIIRQAMHLAQRRKIV